MPGFASGLKFLDKLQGIVIVHQDFDNMLLFLAFPVFVDGIFSAPSRSVLTTDLLC